MSTAPTSMQVVQAEFSYLGRLEPPVFNAFSDWAAFQAGMYSQLRRFGLRLSDIKVESASSNPGDLSVACWLLGYLAVVRYRLDRVEVWSNSTKVVGDLELMRDIIGAAVSNLQVASRATPVDLHSFTLGIHGHIAGSSSPISRYVTAVPNGQPSLRASGVSFLSELDGGQGRGSIVIEASGQLENGTYVRITSDHPGTLVVLKATESAEAFCKSSMDRIGLSPIWGS